MTTEGDRVAGFGRLEDGLRQSSPWYAWGPYVSERQWGTVREDYSQDGDAWNYLPFDHARSRAYRWGEDGLAGFSDIHQQLCLGLALWNGRDAFLKERLFGLTGPQGNHGEDVKEHWWYLDALPSHAWNRWRYHYPQAAFPYEQLRTGERAAGPAQPGVRDPRHRGVRPGSVLDHRGRVRQERRRAGAADRDHRDQRRGGRGHAARAADRLVPQHLVVGERRAQAGHEARPGRRRSTSSTPSSARSSCWRTPPTTAPSPTPSPRRRCSARTRPTRQRLFGSASETPYPKDGINDHVVGGAPTVNPEQQGTKCAFWYRLTVQPGATARLRLRLRPKPETGTSGPFDKKDFDLVVQRRRAEADEFYQALTPAAGQRGRGAGDAAGLRRDALVEAVLQLRRGDLARRRPGPAGPAAGARAEQERALAELQRLRHPVDAGQVGVPVVRGLGPGVPLRLAGPRRPRVRQVPAGAAVPGVVPAPERGAAGLRVGLLRREPAGPGVGRARGVRA